MPGILIFVLIVMFRVFGNRNSGYSDNAPVRKSTDVSPALVAFFVKFLAFGMLIGIATALGDYVALAVEILAAAVFLSTLFLDWIVVPLGLYRLAYWWARYMYPFGFGKERHSGAVFLGARALARRGGKPDQVAWLMQQLVLEPSPAVVYDIALGTLTALNGEHETAQRMLQAFDDHHLKSGLRKIRIYVRDWLVMDAARRGDWKEVIACGRRGSDSYRWSYAVARMAERVDQRAEALSNWKLWALWLFAPRRIKLLPFARRAVAIFISTSAEAKKAVDTTPFPKDLAGALANLAAMLMRRERDGALPLREEFLSIVRWVDVRLESPILHVQIQQRLQVLGAMSSGSADAVVADFRERFITLVTQIVEEAPQLVEGEGERAVIKQAIARIAQSMYQDIEARCHDYVTRTRNQTSFTLHEEWRAWAKLRAVAERLLHISPDAEDTLFREMFAPLCNFAVHQHNVLNRHRLAYDMFLWLSLHAKCDSVAADLLEKNRGNPSLYINLGFMGRAKALVKKLTVLWILIAMVLGIWGLSSIAPSTQPPVAAFQSTYVPVSQPPVPFALKPLQPSTQLSPRAQQMIARSPVAPPMQSQDTSLPFPTHGGQIVGHLWLNYEVAVNGRAITVYMTPQDKGYDLADAIGYISYRQMSQGTMRRADLVSGGQDKMSVILPDAPYNINDHIVIHIAPKHRAESNLSLVVPGFAR